MVDATLIAAPSSTKNASGERDPEMHQSQKGNQWHFGMKAHIGAHAVAVVSPTPISTQELLRCGAAARHGADVDVILLDSLVQMGHLAGQIADDQVGKAGQIFKVVIRAGVE